MASAGAILLRSLGRRYDKEWWAGVPIPAGVSGHMDIQAKLGI